jgi:hypothetical protein
MIVRTVSLILKQLGTQPSPPITYAKPHIHRQQHAAQPVHAIPTDENPNDLTHISYHIPDPNNPTDPSLSQPLSHDFPTPPLTITGDPDGASFFPGIFHLLMNLIHLHSNCLSSLHVDPTYLPDVQAVNTPGACENLRMSAMG